VATLMPSGNPGEDRLKAEFSIDSRRQLRLTVTDMKTAEILLHETVVATHR
jgi:hypothetical protein